MLPRTLAAATGSRVDVLLDEPIGWIDPCIYGHFAENLGGVIYDGVWVGRGSPIPNVAGIRRALIDEMRKIKSPVVRFPGGCFADSYDWRDGIGPAERRPRRTNFWARDLPADAPLNQRYDPNQFGTNEFINFCRLTGSRPYLTANVRGLPAEEFARWVEYCNAPAASTTLAETRATAGDAAPFDVQLWAVGNEAWGCGGDFTAEAYAREFCRYVAALPDYGLPLYLVACGPDKDDWEWTRGFFEEIARRGKSEFRKIYGFGLHYYTWNLSRGRTSDFDKGKGDAVAFDSVDWYELLRQGDRMESLIDKHWEIMGETDTDHAVKLVVDEWGSWYRPGSSLTPPNLFEQTPTLRDAVFSAMTLDTFNRNADKVAMANCSQLINCLNSLYLAHEEKFCVTPVGHVFAMYAAHQGGLALRTEFSAPSVSYDRDGRPAAFWSLKGSASRHGDTVVLTVTNSDVSKAREAAIGLRGARMKSATMAVLASPDIRAHNTFDDPNAVEPREFALEEIGANGHYRFSGSFGDEADVAIRVNTMCLLSQREDTRMSIKNLARPAFGITIAATVLAGCSGAPSSPAATGRPAFAVTRAGGTMHLADHRRSHIEKPAAAKALLYVTDAGTGSVYVYDYPSGKVVGVITGFSYPQGECTDSAGNIYVVDSGSAQIFEFAYGGTTPIATLSDPNQFPASCAVDPNSGALAVSSILSPSEFQVGSIAVYPAGGSTPTTYVDPRNAREYFLAYDGNGNVYVDGVDSATNSFRYARMSPGGKFTEIKIKGAKLTYPAGVQRVGENMAVGDQDGAVFGTPDVYSVSPNGKVVGRSTLSTADGGRIGDLVQFTMDAKAKNVVAPDAIGESVYLNTWPKGSYVSTLATGLVTPIAAVISKPAKK